MSLGAALTGWMDWRVSTLKGTQARRTANAHGLTMLTVTGLVVIDILLRLGSYDVAAPTTSFGLAALTVIIALTVAFGATIGGTLVFDYGFNVRTAGDSPAWHPSDRDLMPGEKPPAPDGVGPRPRRQVRLSHEIVGGHPTPGRGARLRVEARRDRVRFAHGYLRLRCPAGRRPA